MTIAVVILAGGEGSRIGGGKPARLLAGKSLAERAEAQALIWSDVAAIAVRGGSQVGPIRFSTIFDDPDIEGPLGGLAAGLRFARERGCDAALTIPIDMPFLPGDLAGRLCAGIGSAGAALAGSGGHLHPVCGLWRVSALECLADYVGSGRRSLRGFAEAVGFRAVEWPNSPIDPFFNINSAADLARAEHILAG